MWKALTAWARTQRHEQTPSERALRLLWSPQVLEVSDAEFAEIGRLLGLDAAPSSPRGAPQQRKTTSPQQEAQVIA